MIFIDFHSIYEEDKSVISPVPNHFNKTKTPFFLLYIINLLYLIYLFLQKIVTYFDEDSNSSTPKFAKLRIVGLKNINIIKMRQ